MKKSTPETICGSAMIITAEEIAVIPGPGTEAARLAEKRMMKKAPSCKERNPSFKGTQPGKDGKQHDRNRR